MIKRVKFEEYRRFGHTLGLLPNPQLAVLEHGVTHIEQAPQKSGVIGSPSWILGETAQLSRGDWERTLDVNLLAPFFWTQGLLPELEAAHGCVLNVSSIHARLTKRNFVAYATSKAALSGLTRALAVDLGGRVRVNALEPAAIETPMLRAGFAGNAAGLDQLARFHPSGNMGAPEGLARLARQVVEGDRFLHGAVIGFDGGIAGRLLDPD